MVRREPITSSNSEERRIVEEIEALLEELELLRNESSIILVIVNSRDVRKKLLSKIISKFNAKIEEVENGQQIVDILREHKENIDVLVLILPDNVTNDILNALNNFRELFYQKAFPSVIICNIDALNKIIKNAPDFWRYRGSVYDLTVSRVGDVVDIYLSIPLLKEPKNLQDAEKLEKIYEHLLNIVKNNDEKARILAELGYLYLVKYKITNNYEYLQKAERNLKEALKIVQTEEYRDLILIVFSILHFLADNFDEADKILEKIEKNKEYYKYNLEKYIKTIAYIYHIKFIINKIKNIQQKDQELTNDDLKKLQKIEKRLLSDLQNNKIICLPIACLILLLLCNAYIVINKFKKAENLLEYTLKLAEDTQNVFILCEVYLESANLYLVMGNLEKAEEFAEKALKLAEKENNELLIKSAKEILEKISKEKSQS